MEKKTNDGFSYTYSAKEQTEIKKIREKYADKEPNEDKMERLRRLDTKVTQKAQVISLIPGVVGALILGAGMSLIMSDFGDILGLHKSLAMTFGIVLGLIGCVPIGLAYPIYDLVLKRERKKIAPEILILTDELMK